MSEQLNDSVSATRFTNGVSDQASSTVGRNRVFRWGDHHNWTIGIVTIFSALFGVVVWFVGRHALDHAVDRIVSNTDKQIESSKGEILDEFGRKFQTPESATRPSGAAPTESTELTPPSTEVPTGEIAEPETGARAPEPPAIIPDQDDTPSSLTPPERSPNVGKPDTDSVPNEGRAFTAPPLVPAHPPITADNIHSFPIKVEPYSVDIADRKAAELVAQSLSAMGCTVTSGTPASAIIVVVSASVAPLGGTYEGNRKAARGTISLSAHWADGTAEPSLTQAGKMANYYELAPSDDLHSPDVTSLVLGPVIEEAVASLPPLRR